VVLLGDGEYDDTEMVEWVQTQTDWYFVLRTSPNIKVRQGQVWRRVDTYSKQKGSLVTAYQVAFTKTAALSLNLVAWWGATYEEPIYQGNRIYNVGQTLGHRKALFAPAGLPNPVARAWIWRSRPSEWDKCDCPNPST